jgi:hypothetical protein
LTYQRPLLFISGLFAFVAMKISTPNTRGFIVNNHPVIKVSPPQPISNQPPRPTAKADKKKKA